MIYSNPFAASVRIREYMPAAPALDAKLTLFGPWQDGGTLFQQPQYLLLLRLGLGRAGAASASVLDRKKHWRGATLILEYGIGTVF